MMNNINLTEAAQVMPQRITNETKAMKIADLKVSVKFALDAANDGEGVVLTLRIEDQFGKYTLVNCDPRRDRPHYSEKGLVGKEIVDEAVSICLDKLAARFPVCRQLTIDDMVKNSSPATTDEQTKNEVDDLIDKLKAEYIK